MLVTVTSPALSASSRQTLMRSMGVSASKGSQAAPVLAMPSCMMSRSMPRGSQRPTICPGAYASGNQARGDAVGGGIQFAVAEFALSENQCDIFRGSRCRSFEKVGQDFRANQFRVIPVPLRRLVGQGGGLVSSMPNCAKSHGKTARLQAVSGKDLCVGQVDDGFCRLSDAVGTWNDGWFLSQNTLNGIGKLPAVQCCRFDLKAAGVAGQPFDQAILLGPVFTSLIDDWGAVAGRFCEGPVAGFGDDRIDGAQQVGENEAK